MTMNYAFNMFMARYACLERPGAEQPLIWAQSQDQHDMFTKLMQSNQEVCEAINGFLVRLKQQGQNVDAVKFDEESRLSSNVRAIT